MYVNVCNYTFFNHFKFSFIAHAVCIQIVTYQGYGIEYICSLTIAVDSACINMSLEFL